MALPAATQAAILNKLASLEASSSSSAWRNQEDGMQVLPKPREESLSEFASAVGGEEDDAPIEIGAIRSLFEAKMKEVEEAEVLLSEVASNTRMLQRDKNALTAERIQLQQEIASSTDKIKQLKAACSALQAKCKEVEANAEANAKGAKEKTEEIRMKTQATVDDITEKITREECDLDVKQQENDHLRQKLKEFCGHLEVRKQHKESVSKTKSLQKQLEEAKKVQMESLLAEEQKKGQGYANFLASRSKKIAELQEAVAMYTEKHQEFKDTALKSSEIYREMSAKKESMATSLDRTEEENKALREQAAALDVVFIQSMNHRKPLVESLERARANHLALEQKCLLLQEQRRELKALAEASAASSSTSSSPPEAARETTAAQAVEATSGV